MPLVNPASHRKANGIEDAFAFLNALAVGMPYDERLILCFFLGDPAAADNSDWRPRPWAPGRDLPFGPKANAYVAVSSFRRGPDGYRRRTANFAAGRALLVDDVGTKVRRSIVAHLPPSAIVETSPGNEQWFYFFKEPERDQERFDGLIKAFIAGRLLGADPGMKGVNRVGRLPGFFNGKAKYGGWTTKLKSFDPKRRFTVDQLLRAFKLRIKRPKPQKPLRRGTTGPRIEAYFTVERWLRNHEMLLRGGRADPSGWIRIRCPWIDEHTTGAENTAIRQPARENGYYGAFSCPHGHCVDKHWSDLTDWIEQQAVETIQERMRDAPTTLKDALKRRA